MTCDTNCPYRTLNRCTVTGRDVRDLERCPPVSELIKEDDGFAERIAHAWREAPRARLSNQEVMKND